MNRRMITAAWAAAALTAPLAYLEARNGSGDFPVMLFCALWALAAAFVALAWGLARGEGLRSGPARFGAQAAAMALTAACWAAAVIDQWPCFMGRPYCD